MSKQVADFFDEMSVEYDVIIERSVPRYREMFWAMFQYLPPDFVPQRVLELGCGTGNLTQIIASRWPQAEIHAVDLSSEMLAATAKKLNNPRLKTIESGFETLQCEAQHYDLVISSIAIHHIVDAAKAVLIANIYQWLKPGGFFVLGDQVRGANERLYQTDVAFYEAYALAQGAAESDIVQWREHREQMDHYATLDNLTGWMRQAGFADVDVVWRYCFWSVLQGQRSS